MSTVVYADQILVFDKGRVVEAGTHEQLLARGEHYAHLWALQQDKKRDEDEQDGEELGVLLQTA